MLAALDVHTAKWIVDKCFKGDLLRDRTVLLVTHNIALASPIADFVVSLASDGHILSQGTLSKALAKNKKLANELKEEVDELKKAEGEIDFEEPSTDTEAETKPKSDGKLIVAEEVAEGHVGWPARTSIVPGLLSALLINSIYQSSSTSLVLVESGVASSGRSSYLE